MPNLRVSEPTILLKDPLSKEARLERRNLLAASAIGIVMVKGGLVPIRISALGLEFDHADQQSLLRALAAVVLYFLLAFLVYAGSYFLLWRIAFGNAINAAIYNSRLPKTEEVNAVKPDPTDEKFRHMETLLHRIPKPMSALRAAFEFALPILLGLYGVITLLRAR